MRKKQTIITLLILIAILIILTPNSNAALQSNGGTPAKKNVGQWIKGIREMEGIGGTLGLTETIDSSKLLSTSGSNNLDIHMEKNTEYGAIAILSASSYGNPNKIESGGTTTGNETGIVMNLNNEWVAAGIIEACKEYVNADNRYKDIYEKNRYEVAYTRKIGDAITETNGWHGSDESIWLSAWRTGSNDRQIATCALARATSKSIFSYNGRNYLSGHWDFGKGHYENQWASRAIMICGEGI